MWTLMCIKSLSSSRDSGLESTRFKFCFFGVCVSGGMQTTMRQGSDITGPTDAHIDFEDVQMSNIV